MRKRVNKLIALVLSAAMIIPVMPSVVMAAGNDAVSVAAESLSLPYNTTDKQVYGNITLPDTAGDGTTVKWETSHPEIVDVNEHTNPDYDATPAGTVTRPEKDTDVTMTATITSGGKSEQKTFTFTVKAAPEKRTAEDYTDYFFAYFAGEGYSNGEQIYFAASRDGLNWKDLNDNAPVLTSTLGEKGVRDPFIIRSPEGDKFYMIATDLKINGGNGWGAAQTAGSQSIMVWESTDLINWSEQRMVPISASIDSGCTWAPEAYYDVVTGEYIVFWASKVKADNYSKQRLYYAKTRDFYSFTEPKVYIDVNQSAIDTTIMYDEETDMYYRYTKNEGGSNNQFGARSKTVYAEKAERLLDEWTFIKSDTLNSNGGVEGPSIFKFNPDDTANGDYCLLVDNYGSGGYYPLVTTDISSAVYNRPSSGYKMPSRARHGTPVAITEEEYKAVMEKWGTAVEENTEPAQASPKVEYTFEEVEGTTIKDTSNSGNDGTMYGNAKVVYDDDKKSNVLYLDGSTNTYAALPTAFFDGRNTFTVSMDVKPVNVSGNFFVFTFGKDDSKYYFLKTMQNSIKSVITAGSWGAEYGFPGTTVDTAIRNNWINLTIVVDDSLTRLYLDGKQIGENKNVPTYVTDLGKNLQAYLGKSFYGGDAYFNGYFDNFKVYNRVLTDAEIGGGDIVEPTPTPEPTPIPTPTPGELPKLLADFNFDADGDYFDGGNAKAAGNYTLVDHHDGKALKLNGNEQFLTLTKKDGSSLLTGLDELTVTFSMKPDNGTTNWVFFAAPNANTQEYRNEQYIGVFDNNGAIGAERYNSNGQDRPAQPSFAVGYGDWYHVAAVYTKSETILYVNGQEVARESSVVDLSDLFGANSVAYIGKSTWVGGEYYKGLIDNYKIYEGSLTADQIFVTQPMPKPTPTPTPTPTPEPLPYVDVADANWFYESVAYTYYEGLMTGMDKTHFGPYNQLSRAQFALILYRIEGEPDFTTEKVFADIAGDEWYGQAVLWAAEAGIVNGYENGSFGPSDNITREQMAVMMYRYADYLDKDTKNDGELDDFSDASSVSGFAVDAMKWAVAKQIITGKEEGTKIDPQGETARAEAAAIIMRFMNAYAE